MHTPHVLIYPAAKMYVCPYITQNMLITRMPCTHSIVPSAGFDIDSILPAFVYALNANIIRQ